MDFLALEIKCGDMYPRPSGWPLCGVQPPLPRGPRYRGAVLLSVGGEGPLDGAPDGGEVRAVAREYNALIVALEHRYYGRAPLRQSPPPDAWGFHGRDSAPPPDSSSNQI